MASMPPIAVFGCGGWGKNIVRTMRDLDALHAVVEPSESGRARAAALCPDHPAYADPDIVLNDPAVAGVMIATPAETHFDLARRVILAGKDVFVEKPLTTRLDDARELVALARAHDRVLMVGHLLEYHPAILTLHRLIREGQLGRIRYLISNRLNLGKIRTEENALWSFAPHDIAVILRLVGAMPFEIVATGGAYVTPNIADVTVTQMLFNDGVRCHIFVSWLHPFKEQKLVVVGSQKMASFCDVSKQLVLHDQHVDWHEGQPVPVRGEGTPVDFPADEPLREECAHFLHCVTTRETPRTDGENGLRVLELLHAAQRSLVTNGHPVNLSTLQTEPSAIESFVNGARKKSHAGV